MTDVILVVNAGSTSLKFGAYEVDESRSLPRLARGMVDSMATDPHFIAKGRDNKPIDAHEWGEGHVIDHRTALSFIVDWLERHEDNAKVVAAGHRVVLGGERFSAPALITDEVLTYLESLEVMEPSHQAYNVLGARALAEDFPGIRQVACFDTSFHRTMPEVAQVYALPKEARDTGVRHWGYHGISYDYIHRMLPQHAPDARKVVVAHLGGGASMCAIKDGQSVDTSMGFGALSGLPMATRSGDVPAGALFYLLRTKAYDVLGLEKMLYSSSGLLGLSGISGDMRRLQDSQDPNARLAVDYFVYVMLKTLGAYTAVMGGLDALVFTAGIGENSPEVRALLCEKLAFMGVTLDAAANAANALRISTAESKVSVWVIPTNEERMIARHTLDLAVPA